MSYPILPFCPLRNGYNIAINSPVTASTTSLLPLYRKGLRQGRRIVSLSWNLSFQEYIVFYAFYRECVDGGKTFLADLYADVTVGLETYRCRFISGTLTGGTQGLRVSVSVTVEVMPYGG